MSRNNIWVHLTLALTLILIAAFAGGVRHWKKTWQRSSQTASRPERTPADQKSEANEPGDSDNAEVLVRFRSGTTRETNDRITAQLHDEAEARIHPVDGLDVNEDDE